MSIPREDLVNAKHIDTAYAKAQVEIPKYKFATEAGTVAGAGAAGRPTIDKFAVGEAFSVVRSGTARVIAGAAVAIGADVQSDAEGRAITLDAGIRNGRALSAASVAGDVIIIQVP